MTYPTCSSCGKSMKDWNGQVLVDRQLGPRKIDWIKVMCKPCSCKIVELEGVGRYHGLLELHSDFKDRQGLFNTLTWLLDNASLPSDDPNRSEISRQAFGDFLRLIALALKVEIDENHHHDVWEVQRR